MVELTAEDEEGDKATHSIVSLTVGGTEQVNRQIGGCLSQAVGISCLLAS